MAIMARWRMPPENSCGYSRTRRLALGIFTRSSSSTARLRASARLTPRRTRSCSSIWKPTVNTGFSADSASWKIMATLSPRTARRRSGDAVSSSSPRKRTDPPVTNAGGLSRMPMTVCAVTLLPEPDSPSTARVSPAWMW